jgi:hypothetical protein
MYNFHDGRDGGCRILRLFFISDDHFYSIQTFCSEFYISGWRGLKTLNWSAEVISYSKFRTSLILSFVILFVRSIPTFCRHFL